MKDLILHEEDIFGLNIVLTKMIDESRMDCALLINKSGRLVSAQSETSELDRTSLSALVTGTFTSSSSIARLLGEEEFSCMVQEGEKKGLYVIMVDFNSILACVYDNRRTTLDKVKTIVPIHMESLKRGLTKIYENVMLDPELNIDVSYYRG